MRYQIIVLSLWTVIELFGLGYSGYGDFAFPIDLSKIHTYSRSAEIENQCSPFLSSASNLKLDDFRSERLKNELSFYNGDWEQEYTGASLMPFNDRDMPGGGPPLISPWKLVSFEVTDVSSVRQSKTTVSLSGVLSIGITRNSTYLEELISMFIMRPGMSALRVDFEGIYFETEENGGEGLICLLGNATLPSRKFYDGYRDMMENYFDAAYYVEPVITKSDQILLVIRYPRTFSVSSRGIHGEMTSLSKNDSSKFFDKVHISSQLRNFPKYQFCSGSSRSCDPHPLHDKMAKDGVIMFNSSEFCSVLKALQHEVYHIVPNWRFGGKYDQQQKKFGPFLLGKEIKAIGSSYENVRISMQNVMCEEEDSQGETKIARVSAVLRLLPATIEAYIATERTGLSELTLSVEGTWNSTLGQLCMTGCVGPSLSQCDTQVSLYFPRSISINQKNMIFGSISSLTDEDELYKPILFGFKLRSALIRHNWFVRSYLSYNYSKIQKAIAFQERSQPGTLIATVKQSLLTYTSLGEGESLLHRLDLLSNNLRFGVFVGLETYVEIEVMSIGPLLGPLDLVAYANNPSVVTQPEISKSDILNISLTLRFIEAPVKVKDAYYNHVSELQLEGLYDPGVGTLYLVGCRNVFMEGRDIEGGLDCMIEVKVEYSSETTRWLINPTAKITIASQRNDQHPLYFKPISLQTFMIHDRNHEEAVKFRKIFEGGLEVFLLSVSLALIWSQLCYMKKNAEIVPYVSPVLLCMLLFVYGSSLIKDNDILIKSRETKYYRDRAYSLQSYQSFLDVQGYMVKLVVLTTMILTSRLVQLVLKARTMLRAQGGSGIGDVPSDVRVLLISMIVYGVFSLIRLPNYWYHIPPGTDILQKVVYIIVKFADEVWSTQVDFLVMVPQYVANRLSKIPVNPLRKAFFIGIVSISFLLDSYDYVRDPVDHPI